MQNKFIIAIIENLNEVLMNMKTSKNFDLDSIIDIEVLYYGMQAWHKDVKPFIEMFDEVLQEHGFTDAIEFLKGLREEVENGENSTQRKFS